MGTQLPPEKVTPTPTQFLAHVYCGQMAEWMNTPLGTEVDLGTGHIVLDVVSAVRESGTAAPPSFRPCLLWPRGRPSQLLLSSCSYYLHRLAQRNRIELVS